MKTRTKVVVISSLIAAIFIFASYVLFSLHHPSQHIGLFVSWNLVFLATLLFSFYLIVIKKIEVLYYHLAEMSNKNDYSFRFSAPGFDELSSLAGQINQLLD